jgi:hypothetical protein
MATIRAYAAALAGLVATGCPADVVAPPGGGDGGNGGSGGAADAPPACDQLIAREAFELTPANSQSYFGHVALLAQDDAALLFHRDASDNETGTDTITVQSLPAWADWPASPAKLPAQPTVEGGNMRDSLALSGPPDAPSLAYLSGDQVWLFPDAHDRTDGVLAVDDNFLEARLRFLVRGAGGSLIGVGARDYNDEQQMTFQLRLYSVLANGATATLPIAACSGSDFTGSAVGLPDGSYLVASVSAPPYGECSDDVTGEPDRLQLVRYSPSLAATLLMDEGGFYSAALYPRPGGAWLVRYAIDDDWLVSRLDESGALLDEHPLVLPSGGLLAGSPMDDRLMLAFEVAGQVYLQLIEASGSPGATGGLPMPDDELDAEGFRLLADPQASGALLVWNQEPNMTIAVSRFDCVASP